MPWYLLADDTLYRAERTINAPGWSLDETTPRDQPIHDWTWHDTDDAAMEATGLVVSLTARLDRIDPPITTEQATVKAALAADTKTDLGKIARAITKLATLLGDETTAGSVRAVIGPAGATAGTSTLRAIRAKTATDGTVVKLAASVDALAARCIDLAQLVIDTDQAARRTARQVQRLTLAATGTLESTDVGTDI